MPAPPRAHRRCGKVTSCSALSSSRASSIDRSKVPRTVRLVRLHRHRARGRDLHRQVFDDPVEVVVRLATGDAPVDRRRRVDQPAAVQELGGACGTDSGAGASRSPPCRGGYRDARRSSPPAAPVLITRMSHPSAKHRAGADRMAVDPPRSTARRGRGRRGRDGRSSRRRQGRGPNPDLR